MKDNIPRTRSWSVPLMFQLPRGGSNVKRELWKAAVIILAGLLAIFVIWGPLIAPSFPNLPEGLGTTSATNPTIGEIFPTRIRRSPGADEEVRQQNENSKDGNKIPVEQGSSENEDATVLHGTALPALPPLVVQDQKKADTVVDEKSGDNGSENQEPVFDSVLENEEEQEQKELKLRKERWDREQKELKIRKEREELEQKELTLRKKREEREQKELTLRKERQEREQKELELRKEREERELKLKKEAEARERKALKLRKEREEKKRLEKEEKQRKQQLDDPQVKWNSTDGLKVSDEEESVMGPEQTLKADQTGEDLQFQSNSTDSSRQAILDGDKGTLPQGEETEKPALNFTLWNTTFSMYPKVTDWDQQRAQFLAKSSARAPVGRKSRVLLVTGSTPKSCSTSEGNQILLKAAKNKMDYCRKHDIQLFYNFASPDPNLDGWWTKLPVIRMLMLAHPDVEWIWWMDADAWLTDMLSEPRFDMYESEGYNFVLYGDERLVFEERSWIGINTGDMFIRNCQWTLDLLDAWASFGSKEVRLAAGYVLTEALTERGLMAGDDQSGFAYLLVYEKEKWNDKVKLETDFAVSGYWVDLTARYEDFRATSQPGFLDWRWPFVVHFAGCQPCSNIVGNYKWNLCMHQMKRTFNFADDLVLRSHGFQLLDLNTSEVVQSQTQEQENDGGAYSLKPKISDWDNQRKFLVQNGAPARIYANARPRVLLATGSSLDGECESLEAQHMLLRSMKNKIDYCRIHDIEMFHNMAKLDTELTGWWSKLSIIRTMMITNPEVEWIWWVDDDAVFTDMDLELPFDRYADFNLVIHGDNRAVYERKSFTGLNTGFFIIRNCQWSFDLLDAMAAMAPAGPIRKQAGEMLSGFLADRPENLEAEDRSALIYLLLTQKSKWAWKVHFETSLLMSDDWTGSYEEVQNQYKSGIRDHSWPLVTHFATCQLCAAREKNECLEQMGRALDFADNQVLHLYGLQHVQLGSHELQKIG